MKDESVGGGHHHAVETYLRLYPSADVEGFCGSWFRAILCWGCKRYAGPFSTLLQGPERMFHPRVGFWSVMFPYKGAIATRVVGSSYLWSAEVPWEHDSMEPSIL